MHDELAERAATLFPKSDYLASKWIAAVEYLRSHSLWVLEGGKPRMMITTKEQTA